MFSLGYHQCRWNYRDEKDVAAVEGMFEQLDYPVDVIWLDIEHTDGKRYFTWDKLVFPSPIEMQQNVSKHGRKMVTIVDPHIKRDNNYAIHTEATQKQLYIKSPDGNSDFDGWCWPGSSSYLDFTSKVVREWWAGRFSLDKYIGSTMDLFTWNDMNEPSVFNGPEVSMPKDAKNLAGVEHREWHNLYGLYMQQATQEGHIIRSPDSSNDPTLKQRPFVLTRAFWAGSQRFGAMWTGDNTATWGHLKIAAPMLLSINLAGLSFAGADVGGFFGEPGNELFTRWYQAGSFTPFFRGHAHHDTKRREPWVFGEPYTTILRNAAMVRYSLLPLWYTTFYKAYTEGTPVMRTMFTEFPDDVATFKLDDQWMVGSTLLVKPVTDINKNTIDVYLPGPNDWFDLTTLKAYSPSNPSTKTSIEAPLDKIPVFIRGGEILSRKMRLRRSSKLMFFDPFTITIAPDNAGNAVGSLYMDDEISLAHETNHYYAYRSFSYSNGVLRCSKAIGSIGDDTYDPINTIERIEIAGQNRVPKRVVLKDNNNNEIPIMFFHDPTMRIITLKKPDIKVVDNWSISLEF
jgi:alpha 1,3-glucosidase